jgi:pSer/pThr/pTyr-binding forkhead associated (FHA) protein
MTDLKLVIMIMSGPDDGQLIHLDHAHGNGQVDQDGAWVIVFGRREECDISIPFDTQVSRQHAQIKALPNGELWLLDSGSLNGTFVGKTRIEKPVRIERGQLFRLGRTWLRVQPETDEM